MLSPTEVTAEFIALSVVESTHSPDVSIYVTIEGSAATVSDTGRGMQLKPDPGDEIPHAQRVMTSIYPIRSATADVDELLTSLVWGSRGSLGPAVPNANCTELQFWSRRDGEEWTQHYQAGSPVIPLSKAGLTTRTGTTVSFVTTDPIDTANITALVRRLSEALPNLAIHLNTKPDREPAG